MKNKEIFPFIRNNYFRGKQLTVRDFLDEQSYYRDKLRALNYTAFGGGVITGMDVVAIDNSVISVENGYAFDSLGRDIIIGTPILKNINMLDGFEELDDSLNCYLCIEYAENLSEQTIPVSDTETKAFNRIGESFHLFLTNKKPNINSTHLLSIIETTQELYCSNNISVKLKVPKFVNVNEKLIIEATIEKRNLTHGLSVDFEISHDGFSGVVENSSKITYFNATNTFDKYTEKFELTLSKKITGTKKIVVPQNAFKITVEDITIELESDVVFTTEIIEENSADYLKQEFFHTNIDAFFETSLTENLYLAELQLTKSGRSAYIENVIAMPFKQYILSPRLQYLLDNLPQQPVENENKTMKAELATPKSEPEHPNIVASGIESIDIDIDYRGKVYYSSEIIHGLGEGNISYSIGFEPINGNANGTDNIIVFGDSSLFAGSQFNMDFPNLQYSIISYNDKGTFRIAVRLMDKINAGNIRVHWNALKTNEQKEKDMMEIDRMSISIKPNLVNIEPRDSVSLECIIEGCDNLNCIWSVEDKNGGTISRNGVYKAPTTEGVYTVTATSVKYPTKKAVNYIIVSKKREI